MATSDPARKPFECIGTDEFDWNAVNIDADAICADIQQALTGWNEMPRCLGCYKIPNAGTGDCTRCEHGDACKSYHDHLVRNAEEIIRGGKDGNH